MMAPDPIGEETNPTDKALVEHERKVWNEAIEACSRALCRWCDGQDAGHGDRVDTEPHFIEKQYVPNCGEMEGWVHQRSWGGVYDCGANEIRALRREGK